MLDLEMPLPPCNVVIFGATGNVASNKLLPALYRLELAGKLPESLNFVAFGRREWDESALRTHVRELLVRQVKAEGERLEYFVARFEYLRGELHDAEAYTRLKELLAKPKLGACSNIVFYLAIKPNDFSPVIKNLDAAGLSSPRGLHRIVVEKPFGHNWRWRGVPFYLRTGKRLKEGMSMIAIRLRHPPQQLFRETPLETLEPNWIVLSIQPEESMHMEIHAKQPGLEMNTRVVRLNASYRGADEHPLDAYEALLLEVIEGDKSLFIRFDEVEWAWRVVDPILKYWAQERDFIHTYTAGSWGPTESDRLFDSEDTQWRTGV